MEVVVSIGRVVARRVALLLSFWPVFGFLFEVRGDVLSVAENSDSGARL